MRYISAVLAALVAVLTFSVLMEAWFVRERMVERPAVEASPASEEPPWHEGIGGPSVPVEPAEGVSEPAEGLSPMPAGVEAASRRATIVRRPSAEALAEAYPQAAERTGVAGDAVVECLIVEGAARATCRVLSESPARMGFGDAAVTLAENEMQFEGDGVSTIVVPFAFRSPDISQRLEQRAQLQSQPAAPSAPSQSLSDRSLLPCARERSWGIPPCPSAEDLASRFSEKGRAAFTEAPSELVVGQRVTIRAAIARAEPDQSLDPAADAIEQSRGASEETPTVSSEIMMLPVQEAELTGAGFRIEPLQGAARQTCTIAVPCEWAWEVEAEREGSQQLVLTIWGVLEFGDQPLSPIRVQTVRRDINVRVTLAGRMEALGGWLVANWPSVAGIGAAAFGLFVFLTRRRRKGASTPTP